MGQTLVLGPCEEQQTGQVWKPAKTRTADVLRGELEIVGTTAVGAASRLAVAEALAAVVSPVVQSCKVHVEVTRCPPRPQAKPHALRFSYAVRLSNPSAVPAARLALQFEAKIGGKQRLLPTFIASLGHKKQDLSSNIDLLVADFTVACVLVPGKGEGAALTEESCKSLAVLAAGMLICSTQPVPESRYAELTESDQAPEFYEVSTFGVAAEGTFPYAPL